MDFEDFWRVCFVNPFVRVNQEVWQSMEREEIERMMEENTFRSSSKRKGFKSNNRKQSPPNTRDDAGFQTSSLGASTSKTPAKRSPVVSKMVFIYENNTKETSDPDRSLAASAIGFTPKNMITFSLEMSEEEAQAQFRLKQCKVTLERRLADMASDMP